MSYAYPTVVSNTYATAGTRMPNPSRPLQEGFKIQTIAFMADSGYEQRRSKSQPKRTFQLSYTVLTKDQYFTLRDFFLTVLNTYSFTWIHPIEKVSLNVRFAMDTFSAENFGHGPQGPLYKMQLVLEQVW